MSKNTNDKLVSIGLTSKDLIHYIGITYADMLFGSHKSRGKMPKETKFIYSLIKVFFIVLLSFFVIPCKKKYNH